VLPEIDLNVEIEFGDFPTRTFYIDPVSLQIRGMADGIVAIQQAVEIILGVERYKYQIYTPNSGVELFDGLIGMEFGFVASELRRRIDDAFVPDERIFGTEDWLFEQSDESSMTVSFTVNTVFGDFETGVNIEL
jgi:hypothetical protein